MTLPDRAHAVIIGGGIVGASVAYHLTKFGITDVVLIEQGQLSSGTTWHAAGLVGQLRATESGTRLVQYSAQLYASLEEETGLGTGWKQCGGVTVARTAERMVQLERTAAAAAAYNLECEILTPGQALDRYPILETSDLQGAIWLPRDGTANPTDVTQSLTKGARMRGARVFERTRVIGVDVVDGRVRGVRTDAGDIEAEIVVNCAGQWAKAVGAMAGVNVPLHSAEHFYVVTEFIDGVRRDMPILRDPDGYTYMKEEVGGLVVGGFEPVAKPWVSPDEIPYPFEFQLLDEDWDHFAILMESALHRVPVLQTTGIKKFYNGPESFTPDNQFILGESPEVENFFVAAGFNSVGIASAGGAGRALAEWIVSGEPQSDLVGVDIRRFAPFNGNNQWLRARVGEVLGLHYAIPWPNREFETARPFRRSPVHAQVAAANANFGSRFGWERPNFFAPAGQAPVIEYSWGKQNWIPWVDAEQRATREAVALFDQTSFGKLLVQGRDAEELLQWLCTNDVAVPVGRTVYTGVLNSRGTYEADVTLTRLAHDSYLWVTSSASVIRDRSWIERHIRDDQHVSVTDVSGQYAVLGVMGPRSRELLQSISRADFSHEAFPFATSREVDLGFATARATRITYVGELGWELYIPAEFAVGVFDLLVEKGADLGLAHAGYYAINALRLEKGYRAFGPELNPDIGPVEAGLLFATKLRTDIDFLGRAAVEQTRAEGPRRRIVSFTLTDPDTMMWGGELLLRDGVGTGQVSSAAFATTTNASVGLAFVWSPDGAVVSEENLTTGRWQVNASGRLVDVTISLAAPYDPGNARIRS
jgi:glycine cleavage system aminomethyltransferase T/glycine/D-amino acid oxidase-like deaminating enzyme